MVLTSPAITELTRVDGPKRLLAEWLRAWFDGTDHVVGTNPALPFPDLKQERRITFDQSRHAGEGDALAGYEIRVLFTPNRERVYSAPTVTGASPGLAGGRWCFDDVTIHFYLRAQFDDPHQANRNVDLLANRLFGILKNPEAAFPLSPLGIRQLRPRQPVTLPADGMAVRMILCPAEIFYVLT